MLLLRRRWWRHGYKQKIVCHQHNTEVKSYYIKVVEGKTGLFAFVFNLCKHMADWMNFFMGTELLYNFWCTAKQMRYGHTQGTVTYFVMHFCYASHKYGYKLLRLTLFLKSLDLPLCELTHFQGKASEASSACTWMIFGAKCTQ